MGTASGHPDPRCMDSVDSPSKGRGQGRHGGEDASWARVMGAESS